MVRKILFLASNPTDTGRLRLDVEVRDIEDGLNRSRNRDRFHFVSRFAARVDDLRRSLLDHTPNIVHFSGHGSGSSGLVLENEDGKAVQVSTEALAQLFGLCSDHVECVVLNACFSEVQAKSIASHISHVVGMREGISDQAAIEFAVAFYDAIGAGKDPASAFQFGCNAIEMKGLSEHQIPMFISNATDTARDRLGRSTSESTPRVSGNTAVGPAFSAEIQKLPVSSRIKQSIFRIVEHPEFPFWMSISGTLVRNPIWEGLDSESVQRMITNYHPGGKNPPKIMHLDMLLLRRNDEHGHGQLYTYRSPDWSTYLLTFRQRLADDKRRERNAVNAAKIARHWNVSPDCIDVVPLNGKYAVSLKPHPKYQDVILYVFEFCSVVMKVFTENEVQHFWDDTRETHKWIGLSQLRNDQASWSVNGDVIRAIHEIFAYDLEPLPVFLPAGRPGHT